MIPGVSPRKSYVYFDSQYILNLIDIRAVCTKESARFDKKAGELCNIFPESGIVWLQLVCQNTENIRLPILSGLKIRRQDKKSISSIYTCK